MSKRLERSVWATSMEELKFESLLKQISNKEIKRTKPYVPEIWYNSFGDCIEFQTEDVAIVADRIDAFLTIYRSEKNNTAIGFQLKDVKSLMEKHGCDMSIIRAGVLNNQLMSVVTILVKAYEHKPLTIRKDSGYSEAIRNLLAQATAAMSE